jgi:hypothetical protein
MQKVDPKDKHIHKSKRDHMYYRERNVDNGGLLKGAGEGERKRE